VSYKSRINIKETNNLQVFSLDNQAGCPQEPALAVGMAVAALEAGCVCEAGIQGLRSLRRRPLYAVAQQSMQREAITDSPPTAQIIMFKNIWC